MLDCKFNLTKFEGIILASMTVDMASELLDCLDDFEDLESYPHSDAFRRAAYGESRITGAVVRSLTGSRASDDQPKEVEPSNKRSITVMRVPQKPEALARLRGKLRELLEVISADADTVITAEGLLNAALPPNQQTSLDQYSALGQLLDLLTVKVSDDQELTIPPEMAPLFQEEEA